MEIGDFYRLFAYDDWANRETLGSIKSGERSLKLMAHIVSAEYVWHSRLRQKPQVMAVWPELNLDECALHLSRLKSAWQHYLGALDENRLKDPVRYTNTKGEHYSSWIADVLTHVIMHSAYHRGQIAADIRASGGEPAYTDFIHAARQGFIT